MPITPLAKRLLKLADDVERLGASQVPWELGKIANALIEQAKQQAPNDSVLAQIDLFEPTPDHDFIDRLFANGVTPILRQVAEAIPQAPMPMPAAGGTITGDLAHKQF